MVVRAVGIFSMFLRATRLIRRALMILRWRKTSRLRVAVLMFMFFPRRRRSILMRTRLLRLFLMTLMKSRVLRCRRLVSMRRVKSWRRRWRKVPSGRPLRWSRLVSRLWRIKTVVPMRITRLLRYRSSLASRARLLERRVALMVSVALLVIGAGRNNMAVARRTIGVPILLIRRRRFRFRLPFWRTVVPIILLMTRRMTVLARIRFLRVVLLFTRSRVFITLLFRFALTRRLRMA